MDIIPQDEDSEPEIIALPTVNTATVNTATVVKMPKRKSEERSDTEDEVMPKRPVKRRVNNVIFDDSDEESERPSEVDSLDKSNQNLEASCDEEETRKSSDTTVEILQRKEDNMRLMEVNIQVEKLDVDSPEVQKLLKSKGRKKMTEERTEVDGLDAHISVKSKNKIRPIEDLQERIESIENDEEETEEIAKKKPRKRKESVSKVL